MLLFLSEVGILSKEVTINIKSKQDDGVEEEEITSHNTGQLYQKNGTYYLKYEATATGLEGVKTTVKIEEEELTIIRQGKLRTIQSFVPGTKTDFDYQTPHGALQLALKVNEWDLEINKTNGKINLGYDVYSQEEVVSNNQLEIEYKED